jgi:carboxyl-terminal processing protease
LRSLLLDLRGNGGGFMNEAAEMADEFLDGDKLIVYTEGVNSKKREYRARRPGLFEKGKLVLLVDELSASASEVLAGALQDWCRATIIGRRTFGKGLVQEQYPLNDGSAIRLTIARYYTPLGRSIQRSYGKGKKIYMDELWGRFSSGEMLSADSVKIHNNGKKFTTSCKDTLYGGDGITPNVFVPIDTSDMRQKILRLFSDGKFNNYIYNYYLQHKQEIGKYSSASDYTSNFTGADILKSILDAAPDSLQLRSISGREKELVQQRLKALLARYKWRNTGFYQVLNNEDHVIKKAMEIVSK